MDGRDGSLEGCMKMETLVHQNPFVETVPQDPMCVELEERFNTNRVMLQRIYKESVNSPSRLLLCVDTEWAGGVGAAGNVLSGPKDQFGPKGMELSGAVASPCTLIGVDDVAGALTGNEATSGYHSDDVGGNYRRLECQRCSEYVRVEGVTTIFATSSFDDGDVRCVEPKRVEREVTKLPGAACNADGCALEEEAANIQGGVVGEGAPQVHHVQGDDTVCTLAGDGMTSGLIPGNDGGNSAVKLLTTTRNVDVTSSCEDGVLLCTELVRVEGMVLAEGNGEGRFSGVECDTGGYVGEVAEKTHGKHHNSVVNSGCLQLAQFGVHSSEEVLDEPIDIHDHGRFQIILTETVDPQAFLNFRRLWQGESSSMRERPIQSGCNDLSLRSRLVTPSLFILLLIPMILMAIGG